MRFLLATDGSGGSETALELLLDLPLTPADEVVVLGVPVYGGMYATSEFIGAPLLDAIAWEREYVERLVERTAARFRQHQARAEGLVGEGIVWEVILATASERKPDLIVIGSRGLGTIAGALLGSTARQIARHSPVPVLVVRDRRGAPRRILIAVDGSLDSLAAIELISRLPLPTDAQVSLLHVVDVRRELETIRRERPELGEELRARVERHDNEVAQAIVDEAKRRLPAHLLAGAKVERGNAADTILAEAGGEGSDLVVLGSRGITLGGGLLQGSVAERVLGNAHCAVLVVKRPEAPRAPTGRREPASAAA